MPPRVGEIALQFLETQGANVLFHTPYTEELARSYDLSIQCTGYKFHTDFMKEHFSASLAPSGQILVNDYFQVSNSDREVIYPNVFAFGDVCKTTLNEDKSVSSIKQLAPLLVKTLKTLAAGGALPTTGIPASIPKIASVSLGPSYGVMVVNGFVMAGRKFG